MDITCPQCATRHAIDLPSGARSRAPRALRFRCSHCGHSFSVDPTVVEGPAPSRSGAPLVAAAPSAAPSEAPPSRRGSPTPVAANDPPDRVLVDGREFSVPDLGTLQRWILEERVRPDDLCARGSGPWGPLHARAELALFFTAAARLAEGPHAIERVIAPTVDPEPSLPADPPTEVAATSQDAVPHASGNLVTLAADPLGLAIGAPPARVEAGPQGAPVNATTTTSGLDLTREAPTVVGAPDVSRDRQGPAAPVTTPAPGHEPEFEFPTASPALDTRDDVFTESEAPAPSAGPRWAWMVGVTVVAVFAVFLGTRLVGPAKHARPTPEDVADAQAASTNDLPAPSAPPPTATPEPMQASGIVTPPEGTAATAGDPVSAPESSATATNAAASAPAAPVARAATPPSGSASSSTPAPPAKADAPAAADATQRKSGSTSSGASPAKLLSDGWSAIERGDARGALDSFSRAVEKKRTPGALFGRGYANEKLGSTDAAAADYCGARDLGPDTDMMREIESGLRRLGRSC